MPHPEHAAERLVGGEDGLRLFRSVQTSVQARARRGTGVEPIASTP